jgi:small-conductance mechanosensitive channel
MIGQHAILDLLIATGVGLIATAGLLVLRQLGLRMISKVVRKRENGLGDLALAAFRLPSLLWCLALGLYIGLAMFSSMPRRTERLIDQGLASLLIVSVTFAVARFLADVISSYTDRLHLETGVPGLTKALVRGTIYLIGLLIFMNTPGISITPILTALGVGGLAVGLALRDSLANLFAGIHILVEKPLRVGDFIKLESGQEGYVVDIGWRTTRIRMLPNNMIVVPNTKLAESIVTNYYLPETRMSVLIPISVSYGSDPSKVESVLVDEATRAVGEVPGLLAEPAPVRPIHSRLWGVIPRFYSDRAGA